MCEQCFGRAHRAFLRARKAKHKADQFSLHECAQHKSAVVNGGDQQMQRNNIGFESARRRAVYPPRRIFRGFDQMNIEVCILSRAEDAVLL